MIAALFVETGGAYFNLPGVDAWDVVRDARKYNGPWPVVAHPPCARWGALAHVVERKQGYRIGDDNGCFAHALASVLRWGGVIEHPAYSKAWAWFALPRPVPGCWQQTLDGSWVSEVYQRNYGHPAYKNTWLYYVGDTAPKDLDWREPLPAIARCGGGKATDKRHIAYNESSTSS